MHVESVLLYLDFHSLIFRIVLQNSGRGGASGGLSGGSGSGRGGKTRPTSEVKAFVFCSKNNLRTSYISYEKAKISKIETNFATATCSIFKKMLCCH